MVRPGRILSVVLLVGVVLAAFWLLDFRAAQAQTTVESQVTAFSGGDAVGSLDPKGGELGVYVPGEGVFAAALSAGLAGELKDELSLSQVTILESLPEDPAWPVVIAEVAAPDHLWTPVYGRANMTIAVAYASDGRFAWRGQDTVDFVGEESLLRLEGTYSLSNQTAGVVSRPSYLRALGEEAANNIAASLANTIRSHLLAASAGR